MSIHFNFKQPFDEENSSFQKMLSIVFKIF